MSIRHCSTFVLPAVFLRVPHRISCRPLPHRIKRVFTSHFAPPPPPPTISFSSSSSSETTTPTTTMSSDASSDLIVLDDFAKRQFICDEFGDDTYAGTKIPVPANDFMARVHAHVRTHSPRTHELLVDGYAPFCKHVFIPNFDDRIVDPAVRITPDNEHLLRTCYDARTPDELPVLIRYFPADGDVKPAPATFLDLILYSREQMVKEREAMGQPPVPPSETQPWRLISVKAQSVPYEIPMNPITIMRNELISQGGSGVPIDKAAYMKSVEYWKDHAIIR